VNNFTGSVILVQIQQTTVFWLHKGSVILCPVAQPAD